MTISEELRLYLAQIGAKGGRQSRRKITPQQQRVMQAARQARTKGDAGRKNDVAAVTGWNYDRPKKG